jgi:UDPglucose--hexose-1-phosphate uridylyltransferase
MPEYRQDPLTGRMVIVAEERADRPHQFDIADQQDQGTCPFCEGNESLTPGEITAFRRADSLPNSTGWTVRVVPNKYPAVVPGDVPSILRSHSFVQAEGIGLHEVIIDTVRHVLSISELTLSELADMLAMYRSRLQTLRADSRWAYVQVFKNVGAAAGASLPHSHSQLVAMPFLPPTLLQMLLRAEEYTKQYQCCFWCHHIKEEIQSCERIVEETEHFVALCPFVSRFAGEIEIYPKYHESGFEQVAVSMLSELAGLFHRTIIRLEKVVFWMKGPLAYNVLLNTEPFQYEGKTGIDLSSFVHWRLSILPSLARAAGFEWGTGLHINPISPERTAKRLRDAPI